MPPHREENRTLPTDPRVWVCQCRIFSSRFLGRPLRELVPASKGISPMLEVSKALATERQIQ
jgi:hypothetical protein